MPTLGDDFRVRAAEQHQAALTLLESTEFATDPKKRAAFVVGKVTANTLQLLGELVDYLHGTEVMTVAEARRAEIMERNDAIRNAAAAGEWSEFDRLVKEFGTEGGSGGD